MRAEPGMGQAVAIVLAGGESRRLGGQHKPALEVGGVPIVARVLAAVAAAGLAAVVVGRPEGVPDGIPVVREHPPGGGPVAAVREGMRHLVGADVDVVVLLAGDLPFLSSASLLALVAALRDGDGDGDGDDDDGRDTASDPGLAVIVDDDGQPQWLCSAWRADALVARLDDDAAPRGIRGLAAGLRRRELPDLDGGASTDVDTPDDLAAARLRPSSSRP